MGGLRDTMSLSAELGPGFGCGKFVTRIPSTRRVPRCCPTAEATFAGHAHRELRLLKPATG